MNSYPFPYEFIRESSKIYRSKTILPFDPFSTSFPDHFPKQKLLHAFKYLFIFIIFHATWQRFHVFEWLKLQRFKERKRKFDRILSSHLNNIKQWTKILLLLSMLHIFHGTLRSRRFSLGILMTLFVRLSQEDWNESKKCKCEKDESVDWGKRRFKYKKL